MSQTFEVECGVVDTNTLKSTPSCKFVHTWDGSMAMFEVKAFDAQAAATLVSCEVADADDDQLYAVTIKGTHDPLFFNYEAGVGMVEAQE